MLALKTFLSFSLSRPGDSNTSHIFSAEFSAHFLKAIAESTRLLDGKIFAQPQRLNSNTTLTIQKKILKVLLTQHKRKLLDCVQVFGLFGHSGWRLLTHVSFTQFSMCPKQQIGKQKNNLEWASNELIILRCGALRMALWT